MQGELERLAEPSDRDRRERLEQVQAELRAARLELAHADESATRRLAEVQAAVEAARARKEAAVARAKALEAEEEEREQRVEWLQRQLEDARLLARGARQRGYREWRTPGSYAKGGGLLALVVALTAVFFANAPVRGGPPWSGIAAWVVLIGLFLSPLFIRKKKRKGR